MKLASVALLTAVAGVLLVNLDEPDSQPEGEVFVRYTLDELAAEQAWRESWNELARAIPVLCSDPWANQQIRRVQKETGLREVCQ